VIARRAPSIHTHRAALALCAVLGLAASPLRGQNAETRAVAPRVTLTGEAGGTVTAARRITNGGTDTAAITPRLMLPAEWSVLLGATPFRLAPGESDTWMMSVRVPARASAGRYVIPIEAEARGVRVLDDSLVINVNARHAVDVLLTEQPSYAVSGNSWRAEFLVRNQGNVAATLALRATSALGSAPELDVKTLTLGANETRLVHLTSTTVLTDRQSHDDVAELFATDLADTTVTATASARVTIVQRAGRADARHTVASTLRLRAAQTGVGVSPFELTGGGKLRAGGEEQVDFTVRGPAGPISPFGDRDQYSLSVRAPTYSAQLGDGLYGTSPLLASGQLGIGAGIEVAHGALSYGGFADRSRYQFGGSNEQSAFVRVRPAGIAWSPELSLTAMNRAGGYIDGQVIGTSATLHPGGTSRVELELAGSDGQNGRGLGEAVHVSGGARVSYDLSHIRGDGAFAGVTRGNRHDFAALSAHLSDDLQLSASASSHETRGNLLNLLYGQSLHTATVELGYASSIAVRYSSLARSVDHATGVSGATQRSVGARVEEGFGGLRFWGSGDIGRSESDLTLSSERYTALSYGASVVQGAQRFSLFGERHQGAAVTLGADRYSSYGGDVALLLARRTTLTANAMRTSVPSLRGAEYRELDVRVAQQLSNGSTASLRARLMSGMGAQIFGSRLVFLEYAMPLQLPTNELRAPGRVRGQVLNAQTGRGVAGALVRLGPQAALTDDHGVVSFAGIPAGQYRLSLAPQATSLETVLSGEPTVQVDSGRRDAAAFRVAVQRAGVVSGSVRAMRVAKTGLGGEPDSLADAGALEGALVALAGERDTIYRTTNAKGEFQFTDVVSGRWTVQVVEPAPELTQWAPKVVELTLAPGESVHAAFRRVPRHREVHILNGDQMTAPMETVPNEDHRRQR